MGAKLEPKKGAHFYTAPEAVRLVRAQLKRFLQTLNAVDAAMAVVPDRFRLRKHTASFAGGRRVLMRWNRTATEMREGLAAKV